MKLTTEQETLLVVLAGEDFSFGYVYSIVDVDIRNAVAVNINNEYRKADIKNNDE